MSHWRVRVALAALLGAWLVAPPVQAQSPAPAIPKLKSPVTVKVGFAAGSMSVAGVYVAIARGYFQESGITNQFVPLAGFNQLVGPIATGELEIGSAGPTGRASAALMVRKDLIDSGQVKTMADLKGRTVALAARRATMELDLLKALKQGGLGPNDFKLVIMPFPQINTAFAGKAIDAGFQLEPLVTAAVTQGLAVRFKGHDEITPNRQNGVFVFSEKFAARTDVARAWMVAYVRGLHDYNDAILKNKDREFVIQTLMTSTTVKDRATYERMVLPGIHPEGEVNVDSIREAYAEFKAAGDIKGEVNLDEVIDLSFVRHARDVLGPYRQ